MTHLTLIMIIGYCCLINPVNGQSKAQSLVDGGKTLVELIRVIKPTGNANKECAIKQSGDICFKNKSKEKIQVLIYKRTDTGYVDNPFKIIVIEKSEECLFELPAGVYKYQIDIFSTVVKSYDILKMGELKLKPCEKSIREIDFTEKEN